MSEKKEPYHFSRIAEQLIGAFRKIPDETPGGSRRRPTRELGDLVKDLMVKHKIGIESAEAVIREQWGEIAGPSAHYSHAANIDQRGCLLVLSSHSVARNELFNHRKTILAKIQKLPGCSHVKALRVQAG